MIPVNNAQLFSEALNCLAAHKSQIGRNLRGRFIQIFLGMKFFQNSIPSMYSGGFISTELFQSLLDDLFAKVSQPANSCVLSMFEGSFLARTGLIGVGNKTAQNTWRNNLNLQKGVGCYAPVADLSSPTFLDQPRINCRHIKLIEKGNMAGGHCSLCISGATYRKESHRKWLRIDPAGNGYAVTDLLNRDNFLPYVAPGGARIPLFPLIVAIYHDADPGLSIGTRTTVSPADFAADFNFSSQEIASYFDISVAHPLNAQLARSKAWVRGSKLGASGSAAAQPVPVPVAPCHSASVLPQPMLCGTQIPPPNTNSGWDAEQYVASALVAAGWSVHVVARQKLGYDIFAQRGAERRYVEVKSSLGLCTPCLTAREWQQANYHGASYVLAVVENFNSSAQNVIYWVRDPAHRCTSTSQATVSYSISRSSWTATVMPLSAVLAP
ncbi:DUF3883 domain-containing protein [Xanthomonas sacchari]|uniref:DUF3883 domain-containing protein n=1 Tax=Xanthomonas sacchari TaxID=56458 RepID=UPI002435A612|nr:DUF3883 domain-containing protein [Xanthomonas sacchari]